LEGILLSAVCPLVYVLALQKLFYTGAENRVGMPYLRGAATAFVALLLEMVLWGHLGSLVPQERQTLVEAFLFIALPEELVKLALIYSLVAENGEGPFRRLGIRAAAVGAGFAAAENLMYLTRYGETVVISRLFTATPFHLFVAVVAAKVMWAAYRQRRSELLGGALIVATLLHGLYDYLIITDDAGNRPYLFALTLTSSLAIGLMRQEKPT